LVTAPPPLLHLALDIKQSTNDALVDEVFLLQCQFDDWFTVEKLPVNKYFLFLVKVVLFTKTNMIRFLIKSC